MLSRRRFLALPLVVGLAHHARAATRELDHDGVRAAAAFSAQRGGEALLIKQKGKTVFSAGKLTELHKIYSGTKAFWILAALRAAQDGVLKLDEKVSATLPEWAADPRKREVTVAQLLSFTSGLDPQFQLHGSVGDRNRVALAAPVVAAPGESFIYGPASLQVFDEVLRRKLAPRGDTPTAYLERMVLKPLGLGSQRYLADSRGKPLLATGFRLAAEQWARMGQLILERGKPVVAPAQFQNATRGTTPNPAFGMALWNNRAAKSPEAREVDIEDQLELKWQRQDWSSVCICRDAPPDLIAAIGSGYQRLFVIPSREVVVVRFGTGARCPDADFLRALLGDGS